MSNKLTKEEVKHIADLARLELTDEELEKYGGQLSDILGYIDQLQEVDVNGVEPTAQITGSLNVFREDIVVDWSEEEKRVALDNAPSLEDNQYKVKKVL